jgi:predicted O-methyltransferase YrrM
MSIVIPVTGPAGEADAIEYCRTGIRSVPGWFADDDAFLFVLVDAAQRQVGVCGDLLEVGAYLGQSAILLGYLARDAERVHVCDVFDEPAALDAESGREWNRFYGSLTRDRFEANYRRFHSTMPEVHHALSDDTLPALASGSFRFVHVDGSHAYQTVRSDALATKRLLAPGGIVVFDDMTTRHTPGVQAAVWEAVAVDGLVPLALTNKLYATWAPHPIVDELGRCIADSDLVNVVEEHSVSGSRVLEVAMEAPAESRARRVLRGLVPPAVVSAVRRSRSG